MSGGRIYGLSREDRGFIDVVANKKAEIVRIYLPPDANCLRSVSNHCLRSRNYVNVVVGKQRAPQWLTMEKAVKHCTVGLGIWEWASNERGGAGRCHGVRRGCGVHCPLWRRHARDRRVTGRGGGIRSRPINGGRQHLSAAGVGRFAA